MDENLSKAERKGRDLAAAIEAVMLPKDMFGLTYRVVTERDRLTKVIIRRKVEMPDAVGQGG